MMRKAIDNFFADKRRYPTGLQELVPNYLRRVPVDPLTGRPDWVLVRDGPGVVDVRTAAIGRTCGGIEYKEL